MIMMGTRRILWERIGGGHRLAGDSSLSDVEFSLLFSTLHDRLTTKCEIHPGFEGGCEVADCFATAISALLIKDDRRLLAVDT